MADSQKINKQFLNKHVYVFYNDLPDHVTNSDGILIFMDDEKVILRKNDRPIMIPMAKIIRVEPIKVEPKWEDDQ